MSVCFTFVLSANSNEDLIKLSITLQSFQRSRHTGLPLSPCCSFQFLTFSQIVQVIDNVMWLPSNSLFNIYSINSTVVFINLTAICAYIKYFALA